jgi:hypothetical protein
LIDLEPLLIIGLIAYNKAKTLDFRHGAASRHFYPHPAFSNLTYQPITLQPQEILPRTDSIDEHSIVLRHLRDY